MHNKSLHMVAFTLLIVGGLNWGLVGLLNFDLVAWLFVDLIGIGVLATIVYILVGLAAIYEVLTHKHNCKQCVSSSGGEEQRSPAGDMSHG